MMSANRDPFSASVFCWAEGLEPSRNQFVSFELDFEPASQEPLLWCRLHLFADTRYRLFVNEVFLAYGPGRFVTQHPEYDTHDLREFSRPGINRLRVEINYYGSSSYQSMPDGQPGFIAAGGWAQGSSSQGRSAFDTPGRWKARLHRAWSAEAPAYSFAQNPCEICDTQKLWRELSGPAATAVSALPVARVPWPKPRPRSVPYPDYAPVRPMGLLASGPVQDESRWALHFSLPGIGSTLPFPSPRHIRFVSWIWSTKVQRTTLLCFWSDIELNGKPLVIVYPNRRGNQGEAVAEFREGWNFLSACCEVCLEQWSYLLGAEREAGLSLHALPDRGCEFEFGVSPFCELGLLPCPLTPSSWSLPAGWEMRASELSRAIPARLVGWDAPASITASAVCTSRGKGGCRWPETITAGTALWCFDFKFEFFGHLMIEVDAPPGTVLDVAYDDWKREDGCVALYRSNPFTDATDRYILRGGRQTVLGLNPRGGIYLQVVLRAPSGVGPVPLRLLGIQMLRRTTLSRGKASFESGNAVVDRAWAMSIQSLLASTDEAYSDCPWRERAAYVGDSLVNLHLHRLISWDLRVARRTLALFAQSQMEDGQIPCCAPSHLRLPHDDFTLIWILALRDYWAMTGDLEFVHECWASVQKIWASPRWIQDQDGLWSGDGLRLFIDWGVLRQDRNGPANAVLNLLRIAALRAASELAEQAGNAQYAGRASSSAKELERALIRRVWEPKEGRFLARSDELRGGLHANILALWAGVGQIERLVEWLEPQLSGNLAAGLAAGRSGGFVELYFFYYLLEGLGRAGRHDLAERLIVQHYGYLQSLGFHTLPECFHRASLGQGSGCHSWSGAPAIYATKYLLGFRQRMPGDPDVWILDPVMPINGGMAAVFPHRLGWIRIELKRELHGGVSARVDAPQGVSIVFAPGVRIETDDLVPGRG